MQAAVVITAVDTEGERLICLEAPEVPVVAWNKHGKEGEGEGGAQDAAAAAAAAAARAAEAEAAEAEAEGEVLVESGGSGAAASPALRRREMVSHTVVAQEVFLAL